MPRGRGFLPAAPAGRRVITTKRNIGEPLTWGREPNVRLATRLAVTPQDGRKRARVNRIRVASPPVRRAEEQLLAAIRNCAEHDEPAVRSHAMAVGLERRSVREGCTGSPRSLRRLRATLSRAHEEVAMW